MANEKNIVEWLEKSANKNPERIAFSNGDTSYTYEQLRIDAKKIASSFLKEKIFKKPIVILLDKEPATIAFMFACAYSGNFYIPLDPELPEGRLKKIYEIINPVKIIVKEDIDKFLVSEIEEELLNESQEKQIDQDLLYVIFTSGSTGIPKGVAVSHRSVIEYTYRINEVFQFTDETIHGQAAPLFFDSSILPVFQTVFCGATDYFIPKRKLFFPFETIKFINKYKCNTIYWVPTIYSTISKSGIFKKIVPIHLKKCLFVGEVMPTKVLNEWIEILPDALFANLYGPTESTGTFIYYIINRKFSDFEKIPLGKPYKNIDVMILNELGNICKKEEIGEICVRSSKNSYGYYGDFKKSAEIFVQNPLNTFYEEKILKTGDLGYVSDKDEIMFVGRKDFQIKHAGKRIELGDIESAINSNESVSLSCCVYNDEKKMIVAFYSGDILPPDLKKFLKEKLQIYMIPGKFVNMKDLPRTANGKIDRVKLKELSHEHID